MTWRENAISIPRWYYFTTGFIAGVSVMHVIWMIILGLEDQR